MESPPPPHTQKALKLGSGKPLTWLLLPLVPLRPWGLFFKASAILMSLRNQLSKLQHSSLGMWSAFAWLLCPRPGSLLALQGAQAMSLQRQKKRHLDLCRSPSR